MDLRCKPMPLRLPRGTTGLPVRRDQRVWEGLLVTRVLQELTVCLENLGKWVSSLSWYVSITASVCLGSSTSTCSIGFCLEFEQKVLDIWLKSHRVWTFVSAIMGRLLSMSWVALSCIQLEWHFFTFANQTRQPGPISSSIMFQGTCKMKILLLIQLSKISQWDINPAGAWAQNRLVFKGPISYFTREFRRKCHSQISGDSQFIRSWPATSKSASDFEFADGFYKWTVLLLIIGINCTFIMHCWCVGTESRRTYPHLYKSLFYN